VEVILSSENDSRSLRVLQKACNRDNFFWQGRETIVTIFRQKGYDCFFLYLHIFFWHLHTQHENTFLSFLCHPHRIASGLCNPDMHLKKDFQNPEVKKDFRIM